MIGCINKEDALIEGMHTLQRGSIGTKTRDGASFVDMTDDWRHPTTRHTAASFGADPTCVHGGYY